MIEGFCLTEQRDVPITSDRRCLIDGSLVLPPSWGSQSQVFRDGDWHPRIARPDGYAYRPKAYDPPKKEADRVAAALPSVVSCAYCGAAFSPPVRGGSAPKYCSGLCKNRALAARVREKRRREREAPPAPIETITCGRCFATIERTTRRGGKPKRYCSPECAAAIQNMRSRPTMGERGMACSDCGRGDRPHCGGGLCRPCRKRQQRRALQEAS